MTKTIVTLAATVCGICALGALPASAADVRRELTPDLIYGHCLTAGAGSETEGVFGRRVVGTVLCTAEDLVAAKARPSRHHDDDDDDDDDDDEGQEDAGYEA